MKNIELITARKAVDGLSQRKLAEAIGISYRNYQYLEAGVSKPNVETAIAIAHFLNSDVIKLFGPQQEQNSSARTEVHVT